MPTRPRLHLVAAAALAAASLPACTTARVQTLDGRAFPGQIEQLDVLDVQVFQEAQSIRFTNTTARPLGPGWVWLNAWYSAPIDRIEVGGTLEIPLRDFRDEFGQRPRAGGFWAARDAIDVVLVQLERTNGPGGASELFGMVVVGDDPDR
ncbi:MAG: hypothetical protein ACF8QF_12445 [Phycisphaerales bacterium]